MSIYTQHEACGGIHGKECLRHCYSVFREQSLSDLVAIPEWPHLFPSRTQKLSTPGAKIAMHAIVNQARRRVTLPGRSEVSHSFLFFSFSITPLPIMEAERDQSLRNPYIHDPEAAGYPQNPG